MRGRAESAERTRAAIVAGAHRLLSQRDHTALTLQQVAAASGVSRGTIYKSIGSRVALLRAVFEDQGRLIGFARVLAAMQLPDPAAAVVGTIRESCRAWLVMPDAIRKTLALATLDPKIAELVRGYERRRRARLAELAKRLPPGGPSTKDSAATLALLTSFQVYDQLRFDHDHRWTTEVLVRTATASLALNRDR